MWKCEVWFGVRRRLAGAEKVGGGEGGWRGRRRLAGAKEVGGSEGGWRERRRLAGAKEVGGEVVVGRKNVNGEEEKVVF